MEILEVNFLVKQIRKQIWQVRSESLLVEEQGLEFRVSKYFKSRKTF